MGDGANVFNTFSFNKWAAGKREEEIDKESRKRRAEQIKRLKERLRNERTLRETQGDGDFDLSDLIEAIQRGEPVNDPPQSIPPDPSPLPPQIPNELSDDYIFNEIKLYANRSSGLQNTAEPVEYSNKIAPKPDPLSWKFNRRNTENNPVNNKEDDNMPNNFKFNRMNH